MKGQLSRICESTYVLLPVLKPHGVKEVGGYWIWDADHHIPPGLIRVKPYGFSCPIQYVAVHDSSRGLVEREEKKAERRIFCNCKCAG